MSTSPIGTRVSTLSPNSIIRAGIPLQDDFNATDVAVTVESLLAILPPGGIGTLQQVSDQGGFTNGSTLRQGLIPHGYGGGISRVCANSKEDQWEDGVKYLIQTTGSFTSVVYTENINNANPDIGDDETLSYAVGSRWKNLVTGIEYICTQANEGDAFWVAQNGDYIPTLTLSGNVTSIGGTSNGIYSVISNVMTLGIYIQQITIDFNASTDALISIELPTGFQSSGEAGGSISVKYTSAPIGAATPIFTNGRYAGAGKIGIYLQNYGGVVNDVYDITATFVLNLQ
jgi:hypothetical protein